MNLRCYVFVGTKCLNGLSRFERRILFSADKAQPLKVLKLFYQRLLQICFSD